MGLMTALRGSTSGMRKGSDGFPSMSYFPSMGSLPTASGMSVSQGTSLQVSTVYACVRIRSRDLARCTPRVLSDDGKGNKTAVLDHPLTALFKKPNRVQTWFEFSEQMHMAFLLRSNAYAVILRNWRGDPVELIPVNPDLVTPLEAPDGSIFYNVARAGMWLAAVLENEAISIPARDVFHVRDLTFNSLVGVSRIALARDAVGLAMVQEQQASRWAGNGARPSGVLESAKTISPEAAARLKTQWEGMQSGIQNTGKTAILEDGLTWKPMSLTSVDLEFNAARLVQVKEIARFWEVPLHKLGENESLPRASIAELNADYVQNVVMSDATRWEQKIEATFGVTEEGYEVKLDERGLLRADLATMINSARTGVMSGLITQNEGRSYIGYGPMGPDADKLLAPVNLAPNGSAMDGKAPDGAGRPPEGELPGAAKDYSALAKAIVAELKGYNPDQPRDERGRFAGGGASSDAGSSVPKWLSGVILALGGVALIGALSSKHTVNTKDYKTASDNLAKDSLKSPLTEAETAAVAKYADLSLHINKRLRNGASPDAEVRNMDSAVCKGSLSEATVLFRGVTATAASKIPGIMYPGSIVTDRGFASTSLSSRVARIYAGDDPADGKPARGWIMAINAHKNSRALPLGEVSGTNYEVVLPRSSRLRVLRVDNSSRTIHMELM